jgi:spermidine synthase
LDIPIHVHTGVKTSHLKPHWVQEHDFWTHRMVPPADERVTVVVADVVAALAEAREASYDLVLLDVDNGPGYLVHESNAQVYSHDFLESTGEIINPGGALVVWSADPAPELAQTMERVFGSCTEHRYDVLLQERSEQYLLYLSRRD